MIYKKLFPWLFLVSCTLANAQQGQSLSTNIESTIEREELVGITWATVNKDNVNLGSAGFANIKHATKMQIHQKMHIGSVAKTVLAMGVLHLVSNQQLSLDTHVTSLLPQLTFNNPWRLTSPITVQHLLEHSAGLDDIRMWQLLNTTVTPHTALHEAFPPSHHNLLSVRTEPGTQFSYSNMGYTLLGMIIEAVTDQRYETYLDRHFLTPLGMNESSFEFVSQLADKMLATGYHENNVEQLAVANYLRPAGQFTTTASDMAKFITFVLGNGEVNGQVFIKQHLMKTLFKPSNTDAFRSGLDIGHGLVFINRDRYGVNGQCHPGTTFGFRAYICIYPEQNKGFFYAVNTDHDSADYQQLNQHFISALNLAPTTLPPTTHSPIDVTPLSGLYQLAPNKMEQFAFVDMLFHFVWIKPKGNHLELKSLQHDTIHLEHVTGQLFRSDERVQASHVFYHNKAEHLMLSNGYKTYKKSSEFKLILYWLSLLFGLLSFIYLLVVSLVQIVKKKWLTLKDNKWVTINIVAFILPLVAYTNQSFLAFSDKTVASISLAILTGFLPLSLSFTLLKLCIQGIQSHASKLDIIAMVMLLQFCLVLCAWGLFPAIFWR